MNKRKFSVRIKALYIIKILKFRLKACKSDIHIRIKILTTCYEIKLQSYKIKGKISR